ncbi:hypothetical protein OEZ86_007294 [Tetradesmus obliquus]|nr:hypothetical protein OEZ86_007294 [Tetradesmus obliquus]
MASTKASKVAAVAAHAGMQLLRVLFWAPVLLLLAWMAFFGTERWRNAEHWRHFPPSFDCDDTKLLDSCTLRNLLFMWAAPALLAAAALGLLVLRAVLQKEGHGSTTSKWSAMLMPPRRFWLWWCGGLSLADALVVAAWAAINVAWMFAMMDRYFKLIPFFSGGGTPLPLLRLMLVAVALGSLLFPNLLMLFYPVTRGSVVLAASGISYPDAIRYHRWLGHAVMVIVTAHSLGFWGVWLYQGLWVKEAFDQGARINNLAGGISFLSGLALWLSSLEVARRGSYETFYKLHHIGFWGFMFAGCCHYWGMFWYFLPGLMLYGVDAVYRLQQCLWLLFFTP